MRILLAGMSNMLFSIVTAALSQEPDIVIAGRVAYSDDLAPEVRLAGADALIVQTDLPGTADTFVALLGIFPNLAVVAIMVGGVAFDWFRNHRRRARSEHPQQTEDE